MATSIKSDIADAIVARLTGISDLKYVAFDRVRINISDFKDHEIPACQVYDVAQTNRHENLRIFVNWTLAIEIILKATTRAEANQKVLWNLQYDVERALWTRPLNLGVPGVVDMVYTGSITDLHSIGDSIYFARIDLDVQFYQPLVDDC